MATQAVANALPGPGHDRAGATTVSAGVSSPMIGSRRDVMQAKPLRMAWMRDLMRLDMLCSDGLGDVVVSDRRSGVLRLGTVSLWWSFWKQARRNEQARRRATLRRQGPQALVPVRPGSSNGRKTHTGKLAPRR